MHQPEYTQFVDEVPMNSLRIAYDAVRGSIPDKATVGLACLNVASYASGLALGEPGGTGPLVVMGHVTGHSDDPQVVEAAFQSAISAKAGVSAGSGNWRVILGAVLKILAGLLV